VTTDIRDPDYHAHNPSRQRRIFDRHGFSIKQAFPQSFPIFATCERCDVRIVAMDGTAEWATAAEMVRAGYLSADQLAVVMLGELDRLDRRGVEVDVDGTPLDNRQSKESKQEMTIDLHNGTAREGADRCRCGCKYWEYDRCVDCGLHVSRVLASNPDNQPIALTFTRGEWRRIARALRYTLAPEIPAATVEDFEVMSVDERRHLARSQSRRNAKVRLITTIREATVLPEPDETDDEVQA
jgi:hypothetical protein